MSVCYECIKAAGFIEQDKLAKIEASARTHAKSKGVTVIYITRRADRKTGGLGYTTTPDDRHTIINTLLVY